MPYFECLHCGTVTSVETTAPKCVQCGHGTGIIHQHEPRTVRDAPEIQKKKEPGGSEPDSTKASAPLSF